MTKATLRQPRPAMISPIFAVAPTSQRTERVVWKVKDFMARPQIGETRLPSLAVSFMFSA